MLVAYSFLDNLWNGEGKAVPKMLGNLWATFHISSNFLHSEQFLDRRFSKIVRVLFGGHTNFSENFLNFFKDQRRLSKISEEIPKMF